MRCPVKDPRRVLVTLCCVLPMVAGAASDSASDPASDPIDRVAGHDRVIHSTVLEQDRPFSVLLPFGYHASVRRYPVLYVLDGGAYDAYAAATAGLLAFQGEIPPLIVVGIPSLQRSRDLSPFPLPDIPGTGGGGRFLAFLRDELKPFVDAHYRTLGLDILFGHSLGGSFAVHALFTDPDLFRAVLAVSPALYSDRGRMLRGYEAALADGLSFTAGYLYMAVGDEIAYPESLEFLTDKLETHPPDGLRWESHVFAEERHGSIVLRTLAPSLRSLFEAWPIPIADLEAGFETVTRHYDGVSESLGCYFPVPEELANRLGYRALADGDLSRAETIFTYNVRTYPASANVHDSLGELFLEKSDTDRALELYRRALELDPGNGNAGMMIERILARD